MRGSIIAGSVAALLNEAASTLGTAPLQQALRSGVKDAQRARRGGGRGNASNPRGAARRDAKAIVGPRQLRKLEKAARREQREGGAS